MVKLQNKSRFASFDIEIGNTIRIFDSGVGLIYNAAYSVGKSPSKFFQKRTEQRKNKCMIQIWHNNIFSHCVLVGSSPKCLFSGKIGEVFEISNSTVFHLFSIDTRYVCNINIRIVL